jgi:cytochrome c553
MSLPSHLSPRLRARALVALTLFAVTPFVVQAQTAHDTSAKAFAIPAWAFPVQAGALPPATGTDTAAAAILRTSKATFSVGRTRDRYDVADWNPETHPTPPAFVLHGRKPAVMACGFCHLADGRGRPENAMLAGLPAPYIIEQVKDMRTRARHSAASWPFAPGVAMQQIADSVTDAELQVVAEYFSHVRARRASKVVEADSVPKTMPLNGLSTLLPGTEREALNGRLIELPLELRRHELHDPMAEYVAYVPRGSLARGRALAKGETTLGVKGCESCHGPSLRGVGQVPPLAGRSPSYLLRQLVAFHTAARATAASAPMNEVAGKLSIEDMVSAAAYAGSRKP